MGNIGKTAIKKSKSKSIKSEEKKEKINVLFQCYDKSYNIICDKNDSFSSISEIFIKRIEKDGEDFYFYSEKGLMSPNNIISQDTTIIAHQKNIITGGIGNAFGMKFTDVSKKVVEEHIFSDSAPSYRTVSKGINIYGICKGLKTCKGYKKEVIVPLKTKKEFDLIKERDDLECPLCGISIKPVTFGFHLCEYEINGKKFDGAKTEDFQIKDKVDNENSIQYYTPDKNGETTIVSLIIKINEFL